MYTDKDINVDDMYTDDKCSRKMRRQVLKCQRVTTTKAERDDTSIFSVFVVFGGSRWMITLSGECLVPMLLVKRKSDLSFDTLP